MKKQYADAAYQKARRAAETPERREARLLRERTRAQERRALLPKKPRGPQKGFKYGPRCGTDYCTASSVSLAPEHWEFLKLFGEGYSSRGIRRLIEQAMQAEMEHGDEQD